MGVKISVLYARSPIEGSHQYLNEYPGWIQGATCSVSLTTLGNDANDGHAGFKPASAPLNNLHRKE